MKGYKFKKHKLIEDEKLWLSELLRNDFNKIDPKAVKVKLWGKTSNEFDPTRIDYRLARDNRLTLLGLWYLDFQNQLINFTPEVIEALKRIIITNPSLTFIDSNSVVQMSSIAQRDVKIIFSFLFDLGFCNGGSRLSDENIFNRLNFDANSTAFDKILGFNNLDETLENFYNENAPSNKFVKFSKAEKSELKDKLKNEKKIPKRIEKKIFQEANSTCTFCGEREVSLLDVHHIMPRNQGGPNEELNLILVCKKCHADIEDGQISIIDVMKKKNELVQQKNTLQKSSGTAPIFNLKKSKIDSSIIANIVNIKGKKPPKLAHPLGSIGANIDMNNYIKYLIDRYYKYREADSSYGRFEKFNYGEIHRTIQSKFKAKTYFIKQEKFQMLCEYLYWRIDRTIQGKRNKANGIKNYDSFENYLKS